jgi:hypothetical protein
LSENKIEFPPKPSGFLPKKKNNKKGARTESCAFLFKKFVLS